MTTVDEYIEKACTKLGPGALPTQIQTLVYALMLQLSDMQQKMAKSDINIEHVTPIMVQR